MIDVQKESSADEIPSIPPTVPIQKDEVFVGVVEENDHDIRTLWYLKQSEIQTVLDAMKKLAEDRTRLDSAIALARAVAELKGTESSLQARIMNSKVTDEILGKGLQRFHPNYPLYAIRIDKGLDGKPAWSIVERVHEPTKIPLSEKDALQIVDKMRWSRDKELSIEKHFPDLIYFD